MFSAMSLKYNPVKKTIFNKVQIVITPSAMPPMAIFTLTSNTRSLPQLQNDFRAHPYGMPPTRPMTSKPPGKKSKSKSLSIPIPLNDTLQLQLSDLYRLKEAWDAFPFVYRINEGFSTNTILQQVCSERGWKEYNEHSSGDKRIPHLYKFERVPRHWNLWWRCIPLFSFAILPVHSIHWWQYLNHCPKVFQFSNKNTLCLFLRKMKNNYGEIYNFAPMTYLIPGEVKLFAEEHDRRVYQYYSEYEKLRERLDSTKNAMDKIRVLQEHPAPTKPVWISKPVGKSQGKGIYITLDINVITEDAENNPKVKSVVQEYIMRPLLIGGYKCDVRLYVCVTSTNPLTIYMYREGLTRFATKKYDVSDLTSLFSHLTNASLNKLSPDYETEKEMIGSGCKWTLAQLRQHLHREGMSDWLMWQKVMSIVVLTIVGEVYKSGSFPQVGRCFDFFGFDILIDQDLKPWLLEVNVSPGLSSDSEVDEIVKRPLLNQLFDLLGLPDCSYLMKIVKENPDYFAKRPTTREKKKATGTPTAEKLAFFTRKPSSRPVSRSSPVTDSASRLMDLKSIYSQKLVPDSKRVNSAGGSRKRSVYPKKQENIAVVKPTKEKPDKTIKKVRSKPSNEPDVNGNTEDGAPKSTPITNEVTADEFSRINENLNEFLSILNARKREDDRPNDYFYKCWGGVWTEKRDWTHPVKKQGDWIRIYPYEKFTKVNQPTMSGFNSVQLRNLVQTMNTYLDVAETIFRNNPGESDEVYENAMKDHLHHGAEIWIPPC